MKQRLSYWASSYKAFPSFNRHFVTRAEREARRGHPPPTQAGLGVRTGPITAESVDYDLSAINVAAKARAAIVINITALAGMPVRNSLISFLRCSSQR